MKRPALGLLFVLSLAPALWAGEPELAQKKQQLAASSWAQSLDALYRNPVAASSVLEMVKRSTGPDEPKPVRVAARRALAAIERARAK